jgi:hypothetical protein
MHVTSLGCVGAHHVIDPGAPVGAEPLQYMQVAAYCRVGAHVFKRRHGLVFHMGVQPLHHAQAPVASRQTRVVPEHGIERSRGVSGFIAEESLEDAERMRVSLVLKRGGYQLDHVGHVEIRKARVHDDGCFIFLYRRECACNIQYLQQK